MNTQQTIDLIFYSIQVLLLLGFIALGIFYKHLPPDLQAEVKKAAAQAVPAVEMAAQKATEGMTSEQKYEAAEKMILTILGSLGFKSVSNTLIKVAIEATVYGLKRAIQSGQKAEPAPLPPATPAQ